MSQKTLADLLDEEAKKFGDHVVYSSFPYSCAMEEAKIHSKQYAYPVNKTIEHEEKMTTISLPPKKGSGKRKSFIIKLWYA